MVPTSPVEPLVDLHTFGTDREGEARPEIKAQEAFQVEEPLVDRQGLCVWHAEGKSDAALGELATHFIIEHLDTLASSPLSEDEQVDQFCGLLWCSVYQHCLMHQGDLTDLVSGCVFGQADDGGAVGKAVLVEPSQVSGSKTVSGDANATVARRAVSA